jgi:hypothetical protein
VTQRGLRSAPRIKISNPLDLSSAGWKRVVRDGNCRIIACRLSVSYTRNSLVGLGKTSILPRLLDSYSLSSVVHVNSKGRWNCGKSLTGC